MLIIILFICQMQMLMELQLQLPETFLMCLLVFVKLRPENLTVYKLEQYNINQQVNHILIAKFLFRLHTFLMVSHNHKGTLLINNSLIGQFEEVTLLVGLP